MHRGTSLIPRLLDARGVTLAEFLEPLRRAFASNPILPKTFRSACDAPSFAGSMHTDAMRIEFPSDLPYMAGTWTGGTIRLSGVGVDTDVLWYGSMHEAMLVLRGRMLPDTLLGAMTGRRIGVVVGGDVTGPLDETILAAFRSDADTSIRMTSRIVDLGDPPASEGTMTGLETARAWRRSMETCP